TFTMTSRSPQFVHGQQTYVFTYTLRNVTWTFADTAADEFYWDVNGVDWPQTFGRVSTTLRMDASLAAALTGRQACYHGPQGATQRCDILVTKTSDGATAAATITNVPPHETLTIAVGFAKGTFVLFDSSPFASPWGWIQLVGLVGAIGMLVAAIVVRIRRLRDDPGRPTIIAEYEPPAGFDAALSAALLTRTSKVVPAEVLEQAVGGSIRIVEVEHGILGRTRLQAELIDRTRADADGRMLLDGMFGSDTVFLFGRQNSAFVAAARKVSSWASAQLSSRGLRRAVPRRLRAVPILLAWLFVAVVIVSGIA